MAFSIRFLLGRVVVHQFGLQECSWVQSVCPGDSWWLFLLDSSHVSHVFRLVRCCGGNLENLWYDQYSTRRWIPGKLILYIVSHCHWLSYPANQMGWVGLWGFLWWAPSAKGKDHHGVSSGWSSVWHRSNTGLSSTQYEQIPIILGIWPFWLTPFFFRSITFWRAYG